MDAKSLFHVQIKIISALQGVLVTSGVSDVEGASFTSASGSKTGSGKQESEQEWEREPETVNVRRTRRTVRRTGLDECRRNG